MPVIGSVAAGFALAHLRVGDLPVARAVAEAARRYDEPGIITTPWRCWA